MHVVFTLKFRLKGLQLYCKGTPAYVLSKEFCKSFKNTYFAEHRQTTTSETFIKNENSSTG